MPFDFYRYESGAYSAAEPAGLPDGYTLELWQPRRGEQIPRSFSFFPYGIWAAFHILKVFHTDDYRIALIRDASGRIVHRSHVFPKWFRHPFMDSRDLQVGDTFTEPEHRNKGLAGAALRFIASSMAGRTLWYVVDHDNKASIRVAEKVGFHIVGCGIRTRRCGMRLFGAYRILEVPEERHARA